MAPLRLLASIAAICFLPWTSFASGPKAVGIDFVKDKRTRSSIARRDTTAPLVLDNGQILYLADISIGTPPQKMRGKFFFGDSFTKPIGVYAPCSRSTASISSTSYANRLFI